MTDERSPAPASRELAAALRGYIIQKGVTQEQLAAAVGYKPAYMSLRMTGKAAMTTDVIDAAARLTGISFEKMVSILMARVAEESDTATRIVNEAVETAKNNADAKKAAEAKPKTTRRKRRA